MSEEKNSNEDLVSEFKETRKEIEGLLAQQALQIKEIKETRPETAKAIEELDSKLIQIQGELAERIAEQCKRFDEFEAEQKRFGYVQGDEGKSVGRQVLESEAFKSFRESKATHSQPIYVKGMQAPNSVKATLTTGAATQFIPPFRAPLVTPQLRILRVRDLIPVRPVGSNAIDYLEETGFAVDGAAGTPPANQTHGAAAGVTEGNAKPEAQMTFTKRSQPVETIAHWIPATRQVIADDNQLLAYIEDRLLYGLEYKEDRDLLYGDGISPNIQGLLTHASRQTYVESTVGNNTDDTKIDSLRKALTLAHVAEYMPTGLVVNPTDWETIELTKGSNGHYIYLGVPGQGADTTFFRLPVVVTNAIDAGEALVGAFANGTMIWDREEANVRISESHADLFVKNAVAILAEERVCQTIFRPSAFVHVTLDGAPTS